MPSSMTRKRIVWFSPTMPKRGALSMTIRRSRSPACPERRTCSGAVAGRASRFAGTSCTSPSVSMMTAPTRSGGTSARPLASGPKRLVPSVEMPPPASMVRTSRPWNCASCFCSASRAAVVVLSRPSSFWLALLSTTRATTVGSGFAVLAQRHRVEERDEEEQRRDRPQDRAAHATEDAGQDEERRHHAGDDEQPGGEKRFEGERPVHAAAPATQLEPAGEARPGRHCPSLSRSAGTWTWSAL